MGRPSYHLSSWVLSYTQVTPDSYHARELGSCCRHLSVTLTEGKKALLPGRKQDCRTLSGMEGRALWAGTCRFTRDILGGGVPCGPYLAQLCRLWTEDDIGIVLHGFRLCMAFWRSCDSPRPPPRAHSLVTSHQSKKRRSDLCSCRDSLAAFGRMVGAPGYYGSLRGGS